MTDPVAGLPGPAGPRVGIVGLPGAPDLGGFAATEALAAALASRLPGAVFRRLSPRASGGEPSPFDMGHPVEPMSAPAAEGPGALACLVVTGDATGDADAARALLHGPLDRPTVWTAVGMPDLEEIGGPGGTLEGVGLLTVRDGSAEDRLRRAGIEGRVSVIPDPIVLLPRAFSREVLERRLRYLRAVHAYPSDPPLVVQGSAAELSDAGALAASLRRMSGGVPVVVIETEPSRGDARFAAAMVDALGSGARHASPLGLQDVAAAIAGSGGFIGSSLAGTALALAFERDHVLLGWNDPSRLRAGAEALEDAASLAERVEDVPEAFEHATRRTDLPGIRRGLGARLDRHLDAVAEVVRAEAGTDADLPGEAAEQLEALRRAHRVRGRLTADLRWRMAESAGGRHGHRGPMPRIRATRAYRLAGAVRRRYRLGRDRSRRGGAPTRVEFPNTERPRVSIVVVTWGGWDWPVRTLRALLEHSDGGEEVIVVDNASSDRTRGWLTEEVEGATVVLNTRNVGFAAAVNRGALEARAPVLCVLNPDALVRPGWMPPLLRALDDPRVGAAVPRYLYEDGTLNEAGSVVDREGRTLAVGTGGDPDDPVHRFPRVVDYGSAACLVIRRSTFHLVGGLDPIYHPAYLEDVDLAFTLREHGLGVLYEPRSTVVHAGAGSTDNETRGQLIQRNRLIFEARWRHRLRGRPSLGPPAHRTFALRDLDAPDRLLVIADAVPGPDSRLERLLTEASLGWETARVTLMATDRSGDLQRLLDRGVEVAPATPEELEARLFHYGGVLIEGGEPWRALGAEVLRSQPQAVRVLDVGARRLEEGSELLGIADAVLCATEEEAGRVRRAAADASVVVGGAAEVMALLGAEPPQLARPSLIPTDTPPTSTRSR